jgi:tetratricopeptide (TPR) repeat protein
MKKLSTLFASLCLGLAGLCQLAHAQPQPLPEGLSTTESGLQYVILQRGTGPRPQAGQVVIYHYRGTFLDGKVFDSSIDRQQPFAFTLGRKQVIKGVEEAFTYFRVGDKGTIILPPQLAYGDKQRGAIPANSTLRFDMEILDVKPLGLADVLADSIDTDGLDAARKRFVALRAEKFGDAYVSESQLNGLGYRYMGKDKLPEALAVLQWAAELFPDSGNVYDSLGEAQLKAGDRGAAIRSYEKSLALDPQNANARKVLLEIKSSSASK